MCPLGACRVPLPTLLQQQRPAAPQGPKVKDVVFNLGNNDVLGDAGAALTLIEFTDYQ